MEINFWVHGTPDEPGMSGGNPQPYFRQTQRSSHFDPGAKRYQRWQQYLVNSLLESVKGQPLEQEFAKNILAKGKPIIIPPGGCGIVDTFIACKNKTHGDADNIHKGVLDSLFANDKYVTKGTYNLVYDAIPILQVKIKILTK